MLKVTVCLTSYNHAKFIRESIDSILAQTFTDFEFYIIDDCSTDNSWEIITSYKDERIIAIRNEVNKNQGVPRELFNQFKGEYFAIAHCDDKWAPEKLEKQVEYLDNHKDTGACFTEVQLFDQDSNDITDSNHWAYGAFPSKKLTRIERLKLLIEEGNHLCHPSCMIRIDLQLSLDLFTHGLGSMPDYYRWMKLLINKYDIYVIPEKLSYLRIHLNGKNVSGINEGFLKRLEVEHFLSATLFDSISNDDLSFLSGVNVPADASDIEKKFVLGKYLLTNKNRAIKLRGIELIYGLLQDEESRDKLNDKFGFSVRDMVNLSSEEDIFSAIPSFAYLNTSIFYCSDGLFEADKSIQKNIFIALDYFEVEFDLSEHEFSQLRFDTDEGEFRMLWDLHFDIDGKEVEFKPFGNFEEKDGKLYFYTYDPIMLADNVPKGKKLTITGRTQLIPKFDIQKYIEKHPLDSISEVSIPEFLNAHSLRPLLGRKRALKYALSGK